MASYELVASRSFDIGDAQPTVGMEIPGDGGGTWRVIRIEKSEELVFTGEVAEPHYRLICVIE